MANIPILLIPSDNGTVSNLPYFQLYSLDSDPSAQITFRLELVKLSDENERIIIEDTNVRWSKTSYISGEIAVFSLSTDDIDGTTLVAGEGYRWRAKSFNKTTWSDYSDFMEFYVVQYIEGADIASFTIADDAINAMTPKWLSLESPPQDFVDISTIPVLTSRMPNLTWTIPYGLGEEGLHFRVEVDVIDTFSSRNLLRYESKYSSELFQMFDGALWKEFPETGTTFGSTKAKLVLPDTFFNDKYYCRIIPAV